MCSDSGSVSSSPLERCHDMNRRGCPLRRLTSPTFQHSEGFVPKAFVTASCVPGPDAAKYAYSR